MTIEDLQLKIAKYQEIDHFLQEIDSFSLKMSPYEKESLSKIQGHCHKIIEEFKAIISIFQNKEIFVDQVLVIERIYSIIKSEIDSLMKSYFKIKKLIDSLQNLPDYISEILIQKKIVTGVRKGLFSSTHDHLRDENLEFDTFYLLNFDGIIKFIENLKPILDKRNNRIEKPSIIEIKFDIFLDSLKIMDEKCSWNVIYGIKHPTIEIFSQLGKEITKWMYSYKVFEKDNFYLTIFDEITKDFDHDTGSVRDQYEKPLKLSILDIHKKWVRKTYEIAEFFKKRQRALQEFIPENYI